MERLTEKLADGRNVLRGHHDEIFNPKYGHFISGEAVDKLAEYEDLEEQGLLFRNPVATIKFSKEDMQELVNEKVKEIEIDIQAIRNKAFDDFAEKLKENISESLIWGMIADCFKYKNMNDTLDKIVDYVIDTANEIAEQLKAGEAEEYNGGWIPIKTRPMTEEEKEYYSEYLSEGNGMIYDCPLPDGGQEVLITSKYGSVDKTTFYTDCGYYFENYEDYDDVIAWMPLPETYQPKGE